jgi:hypothetical protein
MIFEMSGRWKGVTSFRVFDFLAQLRAVEKVLTKWTVGWAAKQYALWLVIWHK